MILASSRGSEAADCEATDWSGGEAAAIVTPVAVNAKCNRGRPPSI
jgi:hypothetical protein